jgi:hypothetical protein
MTIAANALGNDPLASQSAVLASTASKPPKKRQIIAKADAIEQPEAR